MLVSFLIGLETVHNESLFNILIADLSIQIRSIVTSFPGKV